MELSCPVGGQQVEGNLNMCLAIYIASDKLLPLIEWKEEHPGFNTRSLSKYDRGVKKQFTLPFIIYAGSCQGCSCGFLKEFLIEIKDLEMAQADYNLLAEYLREHQKMGSNVEIYSCWEGDQEAQPEFIEQLTLEEVCDPQFQFKEKAYYKIMRS
ncbi:hypothetical protein VU01_11983 [Candidatus Electrothrix marina]|uniref:Uncharacterized protein n=1 Tax=Candidatus Electrothrix marina TaxID=1859130 RepID=A0A444JDI3_9BACT|nr:hypothetical protein VU01_11983 [Candidatus Electrothrix marina]